MKPSSMRRNVLSIVSLYAVSLVAALGCPAGREPASADKRPSETPPPAAISAPASEAVAALPAGTALKSPAKELIQDPETSQEHTNKPTKFDPVAVNGEFFVDWPKPKLAILVSGRQDGYLEPCGCAGLENQKGGMSRRHALIEQLKEAGWPLMAVDVGNLVRRFGKQAEIQFAISAEALKAMGYSAVGFGPDDLRLSAGEVAAAVAGPEPGKSLFVSANANVFGLTPKIVVTEKNGLKIGITAVVGETNQKQVNNAEIEFVSAADGLAEVARQLSDCDVRILLANATVEESIELAKLYPDFDFVVTADGGDEPPNIAKPIEGTRARLIEVGHKGMYCVVLGLYDDKKQPVRYQRVALDSRFPNSAEMKQLMTTYQEQLHDLGWAGLGLRQVSHPRTKEGIRGSGEFVGGETCRDCHTKAWDVWSESKHAHATESLVKADPPRQFDAECISCHAVGWNPQEFFPYKTGFESLAKTPHLAGNSCENCHGPGAAHVAAEEGKDVTLRGEQRQLMKLSLEDAKSHACQRCHDLDNSPNFSKPGAFEKKYWAEIEHIGKD